MNAGWLTYTFPVVLYIYRVDISTQKGITYQETFLCVVGNSYILAS